MKKMHIGLSWTMANWAAEQDLENYASVYDLQRGAQAQFKKYLNECDQERQQRIINFANRAIESNYRCRTRS